MYSMGMYAMSLVFILPIKLVASMLSVNWKHERFNFCFEHSQTGISAKDWCEKHQLNYATARRHIKTRLIKENFKLHSNSGSLTPPRSTPKRRGPPLGAQNAFKHGGYSSCFYSDDGQKIEAITSGGELILARLRIHKVMQKILTLGEELKTKPSIETTLKLYDELFLADLAIERNIAKIEAIVRKIPAPTLE
jgi:hypothetical protein